MPEILHRIEIQAPPDAVYAAITESRGLSRWWTKIARAEPRVGSIARFRFGDGGPDMKIVELSPPKRVRWRCLAGPSEWIGTEIFFDLAEEDPLRTVLRFGHRGWKEASDFFMHCNSRWGYFLLSLKAFAECGMGTPYPQALEI
jgi:uncharacterized protein YndB with AHSA1/START domain